jgi:S-formylglutathione hydrolase FrmB
MALIHCDFFSETLGLSTSMYVILPQATRTQIGMTGIAGSKKHPVLYLLHGLSDDHTTWLRRTSIERYVAPLGLAVVMPEVHRSFYADMARGNAYWTFISEELPEIACSFFPLSRERKDNFVAGLSMGGYGAFKLALSKPECFAAGASLSGALDIADTAKSVEGNNKFEWENVFGEMNKLPGSSNDLFYLAKKTAKLGEQAPALYQWCGTEDFLYKQNTGFRDYARELKLNLTYEEGPGIHEWEYWDMQIQKVLEWLPFEKSGQEE